MKNLINRLKLAKALMKFKEIATDSDTLILEGELAEGVEVFIEKDGELVPAESKTYVLEDKTEVVVEDGIVKEIKPAEAEEPAEDNKEQEDPAPEETPAEEKLEDEPVNEPDPKDEKIKELEEKINELETVISERDEIIKSRDEEIEDLKAQLNMSAAQPAHKQIKEEFTNNINNKENKALKFFN